MEMESVTLLTNIFIQKKIKIIYQLTGTFHRSALRKQKYIYHNFFPNQFILILIDKLIKFHLKNLQVTATLIRLWHLLEFSNMEEIVTSASKAHFK
jgi:hypothetical protein